MFDPRNPLGSLRRVALVLHGNATLGTIMDSLAGIHGNGLLVTEAETGHTLTYGEAADLVARWAGAISERVQPGDRVVIATPNGYDQILLCLAASRAGALPAPVNSQMRASEISHVEEDCDAALVIRSTDALEGAEPRTEAVPADPGDRAALFYTSGTTGKPKGAELTHRALVGQATIAALYPAALRRDEAVISLSPAHIMGFATLMGLACAAIPVYLIDHFRPMDVLQAIEQRQATMFVGVPAMYRLMLEAGAADHDLTSIRFWGSGADSMPGELAARFKSFGATVTLPFIGPVGEAMFVEAYGMVEVGGGVATKLSPPMMGLGLGESVGVSLPAYKLKVVAPDGSPLHHDEVGELWVKGPGVLKGYWNSPEATAAVVTEDGWLRTGDLARRGRCGTVRFVGRDKDVIKHGGYSVYALEVQQTLEEHPDVLEAVVLGIDDDRKGEVPVAAVRLVPGRTLDQVDLEAWVRDRLSDYKVPTRFVAVDELPRTGSVKVQNSELRHLFITPG